MDAECIRSEVRFRFSRSSGPGGQHAQKSSTRVEALFDGLRSLDDGYVPPVFTDAGGEALLDRRVVVRPRESIEWTRRLRTTTGAAGPPCVRPRGLAATE